MSRYFAAGLIFTSGLALGLYLRGSSPMANAGPEKCVSQNGDVDADGAINLTDAVTLLGHLFRGSPTELIPLCVAPAPSGGLPDTGQTATFGACAGQDGAYATGCPKEGRFTDNADGTVTDNCTGLQWLKDTGDINGDGQSTGLDVLPWCDALAYCEKLTFAGHDDWRLPNLRELQSIADYGRSGPAMDPAFVVFSRNYWSSTSYDSRAGHAWIIDFATGGLDYASETGSAHARAVRSLQ